MDEVKRSFPPVADARTRVLVLGSLPGEESLARSQYYANPRNHFWRLIGAVTGARPRPPPLRGPAPGPARGPGRPLGHGRLRDPARQPRRRHPRPAGPTTSPISPPGCRSFARSASTAASRPRSACRSWPARPDLALIPLPSSSPAYTRPFEEKLAEWMKLAPYLSPQPVTLNLFQGPVSSIAAVTGLER